MATVVRSVDRGRRDHGLLTMVNILAKSAYLCPTWTMTERHVCPVFSGLFIVFPVALPAEIFTPSRILSPIRCWDSEGRVD